MSSGAVTGPMGARPSNSQLRGLLAVVLVAVSASTAGCSLRRSDDSISGAAADTEVVSVTSPATALVGTPLDLEIVGEGPGTVLVDVTDPFATSTFAVGLDDGAATFRVPDPLTSMSGMLDVRVRGVTTAAATTVDLEPEPSAEDIALHVGPRTIVVGGNDATMVVAIAGDRFGNPIPDGSTLDVTTVDAGGPSDAVESTVTATVEAGVLSEGILSDDEAGTVDVLATAGSGTASGRGRYVEVADAAIAPDVTTSSTDTDPLVADGRSVFTLRTTTVTDRFANVVPDGHLVRLVVDGPDGPGRLTAKTIDGVARFDVVAPARPGPVTVTASVDGNVGSPLELDARPAVSTLPVDATRSSDGRVEVEVGPVLDERGATVVDGVVAHVRLGGDVVDVTLEGGVASLTIGVPDGLDAVEVEVEVEVLGVTERVVLG